jgi:hypothetical protein
MCLIFLEALSDDLYDRFREEDPSLYSHLL